MSTYLQKKLILFNKNERFIKPIFIFVLTLLTLILMGYHFGTGDQISHLTFLSKQLNPSLFQNDPFLQLSAYHYSYFWILLIPLLKFFSLEILLFVLHACSLYLTFWLLFEFTQTLFHHKLTSYLTASAFVFPKFSFMFIPIIEFSVVNRTFVFPFLLLSLILFLKKKYILSFSLLGLVYNLHVISVHFILAMIIPTLLFTFRKKEIPRILIGLLSFVLFASPVLLWKFGNSSLDLGVHMEWYSLIVKGGMAPLFNPIIPPATLFTTISGIAGILLFFICKRHFSSHEKKITLFVIFISISLTISYILYLIYPNTLLVQFQFTRIGKFLPLFTIPYCIHYALTRYKNKVFSLQQTTIFIASFLISGFLFIPLILLFLIKRKTNKIVLQSILISQLILTIFLSLQFTLWSPGIFIYPRKTSWNDVQLWAKENTPTTSTFITPPGKWWWYSSDFRTFSQRNTFVLLGDIFELAFFPGYLEEWQTRFDLLLPGMKERFRGDYFANTHMVEEAYNNISEEHFLAIAKQYDVTHIITTSKAPLSLAPQYENSDYFVYKILQ